MVDSSIQYQMSDFFTSDAYCVRMNTVTKTGIPGIEEERNQMNQPMDEKTVFEVREHRYRLERREHPFSCDRGEAELAALNGRPVYGIFECCEDTGENCEVPGISFNRDEVDELIRLCVRNTVTPVTLADVIDDYLVSQN